MLLPPRPVLPLLLSLPCVTSSVKRDRNPDEAHFYDFECCGLLNAGRARYRYCLAALNLGLQAAAKNDLAFWPAPRFGCLARCRAVPIEQGAEHVDIRSSL